MKATQVVPFSSSASGGKDFALEQKPWPRKNPANFSEYLADEGISPTGANVVAAYEQYKSQCDGQGDLTPILRVRMHDLSVPYTLRATYGTLGQAVLVEEGRQEYLAFELATEQEIAFGEITAAAWNGPVYDADGDVIAKPAAPIISGRKVKTTSPVYGVCEVSVREQLHEVPLTISPRTPTPEQAANKDAIHDELYASTVMMFCSGRIEILKVDMPDDFGTCDGGHGGTTVTTPKDEEPDEPTAVYDVTFEAFNYCTGAVINSATIRLSYKDAEGKAQSLTTSSGQTVRLPSGSYDIRVTAAGYTPSNEDDLSENDRFTLSAPAAP